MNADDFGLDEEINRGISESFTDGIVRSVSLVANGGAFRDALTLLRNNKAIGIGAHLCLVGERPLLPPEKVSSLLEKGGEFCRNYFKFFYRLYGGKVKLREIEDELDAQIRKILDNGIKPTHLDSHQYVHLIPPVFNITLKLAKRYSIKWMRYPKQKKYAQPRGSKTAVIKKIYLAFFSNYQLGRLKNNNLHYADYSYGITENGALNEDFIKNILEGLPHGSADITCHPGYGPNNKKYGSWGYHWEEEKEALKSRIVKTMLEKLNIKLINYAG